jgi:hypothetical protein
MSPDWTMFFVGLGTGILGWGCVLWFLNWLDRKNNPPNEED